MPSAEKLSSEWHLIYFSNLIVVLLGGMDKAGSPLIIFPSSNDFGNINDTDIEKIFQYLVQRFGYVLFAIKEHKWEQCPGIGNLSSERSCLINTFWQLCHRWYIIISYLVQFKAPFKFVKLKHNNNTKTAEQTAW